MIAATRSDVNPRLRTVLFEPRGAVADLFWRQGQPRQLLISGPAGTGKTRGILEWLHACLATYPGSRGLMVRKTLASLTSTALVTYREKVLVPEDGVRWYGGSGSEPPQFRYPNGSRLIAGGLDKPTKVMSSEYDMIYVNEAIELSENELELLDTRLRNGQMPWHQLLLDTNPDRPTHWLKLRCDAGRTMLSESRHEDNPALYDPATGRYTAFGQEYLAALDSLTGPRKLRLRHGRWVTAEGVVYEGYDPAVHLIDAFPIPDTWPRYLSIDFGYTNPLVCQWWAVDPDGRLYRYRESYRTRTLVEDAAREWRRIIDREPRPRVVLCDHDAEDRATLEKHLGLRTTAAPKAVSTGIQSVAARLAPAGDGRPRLFLLRDALLSRDPALADAKAPTCLEEELDGYVWDTGAGRKRGEEPMKLNDHAADALRYVCYHLDGARRPRGAA